ncbi:hypothetical protein IU510_07045 [Nocardia cyriacigeorgica]|uniref:hypothetical protein n=1 Tax=Nocardia cyriacigeorgica TaxID=135487 RepID=UPI001893E36C|nr:hypothetical protein [Nocardia cyriacigeorgica]MBF6097833.1 hypothetical protein [Nocardia cyriacigeorgica]
MTAPLPLPDRDELVAELARLREQGLEAVARLSLPALDQAAQLLGTSVGGEAPQEAVERMLQAALDRFEGGEFQDAAQYTFGLAKGLKHASATERRQRAARCINISPERFRKSYEKRILQQTAEGVLTTCREAMARPVATIGVDGPHLAVRPPRNRIRRLSWRVAAGIIVAIALVGALLVPSEAERLEARYDGKDPLLMTDDSCGLVSRSQPAHPARPQLTGIEGQVIGSVEIRTWPGCDVVWGRVLWNDNPDTLLQIPAGWTLHVVTHRPATGTVTAFSEPSGPTPVEWVYGPVLATARGCVYVEAYFTNGSQESPRVRTACVAP